ncbi:metal-dependent hydrolase [Halomonas sp. MCCC 1A17488]|uniref:Metal-dependent hydrolase n=1 Tax=Billgrantia sulfidoxydans TaxID=2733484 RepID=A0ABX7W913_9GAMM|nr:MULTISPECIES: metal-dependent hydrolase [Halomonas]MCE8017881.1 metal-dependent hydrolase [Halomonas sp. MCCC 1A17488]MCG3241214.1 metal-dependent hydrolase [Halomonas sp. MCCC 1A17488]QPP49061.1 metal-dependent hydrolase [Halomonas sp. SS10-MC5]QTP56396.1 metal-dependent hydrolase [Halomonas sulfidoxydans]
MDTLTQAALGAAVGGTVLGHRLGRKAILLGAALGTLPDLDVFIDYGDAVANVTEHRGFSHSLFVLTGLGTLLAGLARRFAAARDISLGRWWAYFMLCLVTHPLLDALTTYGTQLWWPLDVRPSAWPVVFIIDPLYTLPLLAGIGIALIGGNGWRGPAWGLSLSCAYLLFAMLAKGVVEHRLAPVLAERGLEEAPRLVQPTPFNTLLWRATVIDGDRHHEALVGLLDGDTPPIVETFHRGAEFESAALAFEKGRRLDWFAGPFIRYELREWEGREALIATDLRLGFPGFYAFGYALAAREGEAWRPLEVTELVASDSRADLATLGRLGGRMLDAQPPLCTSRFVAERWVANVPGAC